MEENQKKLFDILPQDQVLEIIGESDRWVASLHIDSRTCRQESAFIALTGTASDGHLYITKAIEKGATTIICQTWPNEGFLQGITYVKVKNSRAVAGIMADRFYEQVSDQLMICGVTGTNGKTTVATLLYRLFTALGHTCGLISTVENRIGDEVIPATHTTPDVIQLHGLLYEMYSRGCSHVFMEVSSHAIVQDRIGGIRFTLAMFTNITQDHLDYHKTMENYIEAKKMFFDSLSKDAFALVNLDDKRGMVMVQNTRAQVKTLSLRTMADFKGVIMDNAITGLVMKFNGREVHAKLIGDFNAYNLLTVFGAAVLLGKPAEDVLTALSALTGPPGRFEQIVDPDSGTCGIVDYAHTPDALENVLDTIAKIKNKSSRIITVVGCGGDRDRTKRPIMAGIGCEKSDVLIITSDNPRSENPETILDEMEKGIPESQSDKVLRVTDRKAAIKTGVMMAKPGDIILVAGKGHETYQEIMGVKTPFDDKKFLTEFLIKSRE